MGIDAYNDLFKWTTGEILFDGLSSKQYSLHKGEGQLVGEIVMNRRDIMNRNLTGRVSNSRGAEIRDFNSQTIGRENELKNEKCDI